MSTGEKEVQMMFIQLQVFTNKDFNSNIIGVYQEVNLKNIFGFQGRRVNITCFKNFIDKRLKKLDASVNMKEIISNFPEDIIPSSLFFDFIMVNFDKKLKAIEIDGNQHFNITRNKTIKDLATQVVNDAYKDYICDKYNIEIIRQNISNQDISGCCNGLLFKLKDDVLKMQKHNKID